MLGRGFRVTAFTLATVPARLAERGDPWAEIDTAKRDLRAIVTARGSGAA